MLGTQNQFSKLLGKYDAEYIDFYNFGIEDTTLHNAGFSKKTNSDKIVIPNYFEPFEMKNIDIAFLPIMGRATMDLEEAVEAAIKINPKIAIPMHRRGASEEEFKKKVETESDVRVLAIAEGDEVDP